MRARWLSLSALVLGFGVWTLAQPAARSVRLTLDDDPDAPSDTLHLVTDEGTLELDLPWGNGRQAQKLLEPLVRVELG